MTKDELIKEHEEQKKKSGELLNESFEDFLIKKNKDLLGIAGVFAASALLLMLIAMVLSIASAGHCR